MNTTIRISDNLIETMTLAAIEAYVLGDGRGKRQIETLGYIWGTKVKRDGDLFLYLSRGSVSLSAQRTRNSVQPEQDAVLLKNAVISRWAPEASLLGDFHTHPYQDRVEVASFTGFEFSDSDFKGFLEDDYIWSESDNNPVMLAVTICKLARVVESVGGNWVRSNVWQFDVGEYRLWVNVAVGYLEADGTRCHSGNTYSKVLLDLTRFYNCAGDRLLQE